MNNIEDGLENLDSEPKFYISNILEDSNGLFIDSDSKINVMEKINQDIPVFAKLTVLDASDTSLVVATEIAPVVFLTGTLSVSFEAIEQQWTITSNDNGWNKIETIPK